MPPALPLSLLALPLILSACSQDNGLAPAEIRQYYAQEGSSQVDVLWVIDNSISMAEEQALVAGGFETFLQGLRDAGGDMDLQIGAVTTDIDESNPDRGVLLGTPAWLTGDEPDFADQFRARVRVGTGGSDKEQGLSAASLALSTAGAEGENAGFLREGATLALVFVSDENDCSHGGVFPDDSDAALCYDRQDDLIPLQDFVTRFAAAPLGGGRVIASAIAGPDAGDGCTTATPGHRYRTAADKLDGVFGDICDSDYAVIMDELARQIVAPARVFSLEHAAQLDTLTVEVDDEALAPDLATSWWYDEAYPSVRFDGDYFPPPGSEVWITYLIEH